MMAQFVGILLSKAKKSGKAHYLSFSHKFYQFRIQFGLPQSHEDIGSFNLSVRVLNQSVIFCNVCLASSRGHDEMNGWWGCVPRLNL